MVPTASRPQSDDERGLPYDRTALVKANINPETCLANDYLNQFNEAIMLLELIAGSPQWAEDLLAWQPRSYREHFSASKLKHRDLALAAYEAAASEARQQIDQLGGAMNGILVSLCDAMRANGPESIALLAPAAAAHLRLLVSRASAVINGGTFGQSRTQSAVDSVLSR
jgi:hypothetical protein